MHMQLHITLLFYCLLLDIYILYVDIIPWLLLWIILSETQLGLRSDIADIYQEPPYI